MKRKLVGLGLLLAAGETVYIFLIALFFQNAERIAGPEDKSLLAPAIFLTLLVISAAISGALVFGKPVLLYLDGKKKDALSLFGFTVGWLAIFLIILLLALAKLR